MEQDNKHYPLTGVSLQPQDLFKPSVTQHSQQGLGCVAHLVLHTHNTDSYDDDDDDDNDDGDDDADGDKKVCAV